MRAGVLFEAGWWNSTQQQNGNGTYVFTSNDAYNLSTPSTYTVRVGDPLVEYSQVKAGWFLQDDVRLAKTFSVSLGLRQEIQTQVNDWLTSRRARPSPGTPRARPRSAAATASSMTGTTRASTSRPCASTASTRSTSSCHEPQLPGRRGHG